MKLLVACVVLLLLPFGAVSSDGQPADLKRKDQPLNLFLGDVFNSGGPGGDRTKPDTVKVVDLNNVGAGVKVVVQGEPVRGPYGARTFWFRQNKLVLVNQNQGDRPNGTLLQYQAGANVPFPPLRPLVPDAGLAPVEAIQVKDIIYVVDIGDAGGVPGFLRAYDAGSGNLRGVFDTSGFAPEFHPTGVTCSPDDDGLLYVTARALPPTDDFNNKGYILRFDINTMRLVSPIPWKSTDDPRASPCLVNMRRPDSPRFAPDGTLVVTAFRKDGSDVDRIIRFNKGRCTFFNVDDSPELPRIYAQKVVFGPKGKLYAALNVDTASCEVRTYPAPYDGSGRQVVFASNAVQFPRGIAFRATRKDNWAYEE
eukprot:jgi/Chrzof1/14596/Cz09g08240.t1